MCLMYRHCAVHCSKVRKRRFQPLITKENNMNKLGIVSIVFAAAVAAVTVLVIVLTCGEKGEGESAGNLSLTVEESEIVSSADSVMRVLVVTDSTDAAVLRRSSVDFNASDLLSDTYSRLAGLMVATVTSPEQGGVGIAGPQVGISRRVVAVQRFDKEGKPFEVYPNIRIDSMSGEQVPGREGCLSIPGKRGVVPRSRNIVISYSDIGLLKNNPSDLASSMVRDTVSGFTAVIFQHEVDHLDGILYTDRAEEVIEY